MPQISNSQPEGPCRQPKSSDTVAAAIEAVVVESAIAADSKHAHIIYRAWRSSNGRCLRAAFDLWGKPEKGTTDALWTSEHEPFNVSLARHLRRLAEEEEEVVARQWLAATDALSCNGFKNSRPKSSPIEARKSCPVNVGNTRCKQ